MMRLSLKSALTVSFKTPFPSREIESERERERESSHLSRLYTAVLQLSDSRQERAAWQLSVTPALAFAGRRENACKGRTECWILLILQEGFLSTNYSKVALLWGNSLSSRIRAHTLGLHSALGEENKHLPQDSLCSQGLLTFQTDEKCRASLMAYCFLAVQASFFAERFILLLVKQVIYEYRLRKHIGWCL